MDWKVLFSITLGHIWRAKNMTTFELKMKKVFYIFNTLYVDFMATNQIYTAKEKGN